MKTTMTTTFKGRAAIVSALPTLVKALATNPRQRIRFTFENFGTFEAGYRMPTEGTLVFNLNGDTMRIIESGGDRALISPKFNNLTPHTLESITIL